MTSAFDNREKLLKTAGYYAGFVGLGAAVGVIGPTLPGLAQNTHTPVGQLGLVFTARSLGYLAGSWGVSKVYDRLPGHPVMTAALLGIAALLALVPVLPWLAILLMAVFLLGLGQATLDVGGNTLVVRVNQPREGPFLNALHFFFGVGAFLAPTIVGWMVSATHSISGGYWILALLMLPAALWLWRQPSPPVLMVTQAETAGSRADPWIMGFIAAFFFLYVGVEVGFSGWISSYTLAMGLGNGAEAAFLASAFWGTFTVGRLVSIPLAARVRPRYLLLADLLGILAGVGLMALLPQSRPALWVGTLTTGLFAASAVPTLLALASRRLTLTGRITGFFFSVASLGSMALPLALGLLIENLGPRSVMVAFALNTLVMLGLWGVLMARTAQVAHRPA